MLFAAWKSRRDAQISNHRSVGCQRPRLSLGNFYLCADRSTCFSFTNALVLDTKMEMKMNLEITRPDEKDQPVEFALPFWAFHITPQEPVVPATFEIEEYV